MSESELFDAYHGSGAIWLGMVSLYMSVLFAYLVTAYFVGAKLSRQQVTIVSGLFATFALFLIVLLHSVSARLAQFAPEIRALNPDRLVLANSNWAAVFSTILALAFVVGLGFMLQVRREAKRHRK